MPVRTMIRMASGQTVEAAQVYTVTQLNQHCGEVMREIARIGRPAAVTRQGKFVALITPLADVDVESVVLSEGPLADEFDGYQRAATLVDSLSADDVDELIESQSSPADSGPVSSPLDGQIRRHPAWSTGSSSARS
jgi:antitoxin (DNA-binding transcriptional repressor) of toxin-antitoxin stability system